MTKLFPGIKILIAGSLLLTFILLCPLAAGQFANVTGKIFPDLSHLLKTTSEERDLEAYGDRDIMGYGYLKKILNGIPDPHFFPFTRYPYFGMNAQVVFPENRPMIDKRMLVGIDLRPEDLVESRVAAATPITQIPHGNIATTGWIFMTQWDYDQITSLVLHFPPSSLPNPQHIKATLLYSPDERTPVGSWSWPNVKITDSVRLPLDKPLSEIYSRGSLPFVLFIENLSAEGGAPAKVLGVDILGVKVQTQGYTVIHREDRCFTALDTSFLKEVVRQGPASWLEYIRRMTNTPEVLDIFKTDNGQTNLPSGKTP